MGLGRALYPGGHPLEQGSGDRRGYLGGVRGAFVVVVGGGAVGGGVVAVAVGGDWWWWCNWCCFW